MLQITLHAPFLDETILEFDSDDDIDTLLYQIISVSGKEIEPTNLVLLDKHGRDLVAVEDLSDVKYKQEHSGAANMKDTYYAEVWCVTKDSCDTLKLCTSCIPELPPTNTPGFAVDIEGLIQPVYSLVGTPYSVCGRCQQFFDMSLLTTKVAGLQGFQCNMRQLVEIGFAPPAAAEQAQLPEDIRTFTASSYPVVLYLKRQLLDRALAQLRSRPSSSGRSQEQHQQQLQHFQSRLASTARAVMVYEDPKQQAVALQHIDFERVRAYSEEHLAGSLAQATDARTQEPLSLTEERRVLEDKALLAGLMRWFKCDFFRWCNKPQCDNPLCGASPGRMDGIGAAEPSAEEKSVGWAGRTELYRCQDCAQTTRFARFNNPAHLLLTRRGRCGEFANAFCLVLRSLGLDARYVMDFTDHVWCEVWLPSMQRYVHCDPCERALDTPLMYESGWGKKLTHVLSFSRHGVSDASPRYSRKQSTVLIRRCGEVLNEGMVAGMLTAKDQELASSYAMRRATSPAVDLPWDLLDGVRSFLTTPLRVLAGGAAAARALSGADVSWVALQQRRRLQQRELHALRLSTDLSSSAHCTQGRISGDLDWKLARGETGQATAGDKVSAKGAPIAVAPGLLSSPEWLRSIPDGSRLYLPTSRVLAAVRLEGASPCHRFPNPLLPFHSTDGGVLLRLGGSGKLLSVGNDPSALRKVARTVEMDTTALPPVRRTCNGVVTEHCLPQYATCVTHSGTDPIPFATVVVSIHRIEGFCCATASEVLYPEGADRSVGHMVVKATARCAEDSSLAGFSIVMTPNPSSAGGVEAGEVAYVLLFVESGYPLMACTGLTVETHIRLLHAPAASPSVAPPSPVPNLSSSKEEPGAVGCVETGCLTEALPLPDPAAATAVAASLSKSNNGTTPSSSAPSTVVQMVYYFLGGASHGDTVPFDGAAYLSGLLPRVLGARLSRITLWAGDNLVNGVQCHFDATNPAEPSQVPFLSTPPCSSDQDSPRAHELALGAGDRVVSVRCRSGALVDSLELVTAAGQSLRVGGAGGSEECQIDIPAEMELCGFFGGTGGHLHNIGVVLRVLPAALDCAEHRQSALVHKLLALVSAHNMHNCGLLDHWGGGGRKEAAAVVELLRGNALGGLVGILLELLQGNSEEAASACLKSNIAYVRNILKNPLERKYQTIKLTNSVLQQTVLRCRAGLLLLCFGPAAFSLVEVEPETGAGAGGRALVLRSAAADLLARDKSAPFRRQYEGWLAQYADFLAAVEVAARV